MKQSGRDKRNYIIIGLCAIVAIMAVGFAAFSQQLTINSTSEVTSTWDVHIKEGGVSYKNAVDATSTLAEKTSNLVATFACNLTTPGTSTISYDVVVENKGSLNAKLDSIELTGGNDAIAVVTSPTNASLSTSPIILAPNDETTITVTVSYNDINTVPTGDGLRTNIVAKLNFSQTSDAPVPAVQTYTFAGQTVELATEGDGLYDNGDGTYTYKGANPANYLSFAGNTWRILGIDSTGIKIISDEAIDLTGYSGVGSTSTSGRFDSQGLRDSSSNGAGGTYCSQGSYGCNIWSKDYAPFGDYTNGSKTGTVLLDSELKMYLNGTYYTSTLNSNTNIVEGTYNVGPYNNESSYTWTGKVALLTAPEYNAAGGKTSYLKKSYDWWLLSPSAYSSYSVYCVRAFGSIINNDAGYHYGVRPVLYLSSNITLTGTGTDTSNAFTII